LKEVDAFSYQLTENVNDALEYDEVTFEAAMDGWTFTISIDEQEIELCENGLSRQLTKENAKEYIKLVK